MPSEQPSEWEQLESAVKKASELRKQIATLQEFTKRITDNAHCIRVRYILGRDMTEPFFRGDEALIESHDMSRALTAGLVGAAAQQIAERETKFAELVAPYLK